MKVMRRWAVGASLVATSLIAVAIPASPAPKTTCARSEHPGGEWRSYGHDYLNTRNQDKEKKIGPMEAATLAPAWVFSADDAGGKGDFTGTPVVADGCLYMGSNEGWVFAINADNGKPVWSTKIRPGTINSSLNVTGGRVFAGVSDVGRPYLLALDQTSGEPLWRTVLDSQPGADVYGSPVVFDGTVIIGVSGGAAELGDESDRYRFQGSFVLIDAATGKVLKKTWVIRPPDENPKKPKDDFAGATIWSTAAVDQTTKTGFLVSGNPFRPQAEHKHANSILKIDLDRSNRTFGQIVDHYKGDVDEYIPNMRDLPCYDFPGNDPPYYPQGIGACSDLDMDFGASPNIFFDADGRKVVGAGQKSGVYHAVNPTNMKGLWKTPVGPPSAVGGIVGSTAYDKDGIYGPLTLGGYLWSINKDAGTHRWVAPVGDGAHWGNPVSVANGVVYTVDLKGFLNAYDATTGAPLLATSMWIPTDGEPPLSWGGVSIARHTVYAAAGITGLENGHVIAYKPSDVPPESMSAARGSADVVAAAGPAAKFYGYGTPVIAIDKGSGITFNNFDLERHDFVQDVETDGFGGPKKMPWCERDSDKHRHSHGGPCPVFWSDLIGLGQSTRVLGLENGKAGKTYSFFCTLHHGMKGKLIVR